MRRAVLGFVLALGPLGPLVPAAGAQDSATVKRSTAPLFTKRDAFIGLGFVAATVALFPADKRLAGRLQDSTTQANRFLHHTATNVELITNPGAYVIGGGLYVVGRLAHIDRMADLGLHGTEAVILGGAITGILKGAAGRARPFVTSDTNATDFKFGRGFSHSGTYSSFPSGHSTAAFAAASAVTSETSRWWPRATWAIAPVMYGGATLVAASRMYHNKHWASDVALGAGIGTFSGLKVVRYNHSHPNNRIDRWLLGVSAGPDGMGGSRLTIATPWPGALR